MAGQTITQKILARAAKRERVEPGETIWVTPDKVFMYDWWGIVEFFDKVIQDEFGLERVKSPEKTTIFIDHMVPPANTREAEFVNFVRQFAKRSGINLVEGQGIGHQVAVDEGLANPAELVAHFDQHVQVIGAVGALSLTLLLDMLTQLVLGEFWVEVPKSLRVNFKGTPGKGVTSRDILHYLMTKLGKMGALNSVIEMGGEGARQISIDGRRTICGMSTFVGAVSALFEPDEVTKDFYQTIAPERKIDLIKPDADAQYLSTLDINLEEIEPQIAPPPNPLPSVPVTELKGMKIQQGYIGSCVGGHLENLQIAAKILKGRKVKEGFRLNIVPSSRKVMLQAEEEGLIKIFLEAGALLGFPSCDYCYGRLQATEKGSRALSTGTMNVPGRMGSTEAEIYMASPATIAATAITGELTDPREFMK